MIAKTTRLMLAAAFGVLLTGAAEAQGTWTKRAPAPILRSEVAVVAIGGKVYEVGGGILPTDGGQGLYASTLLQEYDPATDRWRDLAPIPQGLSHIGAAAWNGKLYVAGGFTIAPAKGPEGGHQGASTSVFAYDPVTNSWQTLPPFPTLRGSVGLAAVAGKLHVIGGRAPDQKVVGTHEIYDLATGKWSAAEPLPTPRDHLGIIALDGRIHVVGGRTTPHIINVNVAAHEIFDPATGKWTQAAPLPNARSSGAIAAYRGMVLYAGGECKDPNSPTPFSEKETYTENEAFDPKTGKWTTLAPLPVGIHAFGAGVVNDSVYFVGGTHGCGGHRPSRDVMAFKLP